VQPKKLYSQTLIQDRYSALPREWGCFLVAGGSDYRAYEVLRKFCEHGSVFKNVLFFDFCERNKDVDETIYRAYNSYMTLNLKVTKIPCSITDASSCIKSLEKYSKEINCSPTAIDISCFTKPFFFLILKYLKEQIRLKCITVFYTEPRSYLFSKGLLRSYHSSYGALTVHEMPGFPGIDTRCTQKILVVLLGFDGELSSFITEEVAPDETIIVNGFPGYSPKFKDISLINNERLLGTSSELLYARADNPFETFNVLGKIRRSYENTFMNIAPLGTKPMALGACMYAICDPSVRVVYPLPERYANVTTEQCWHSWVYMVPLV